MGQKVRAQDLDVSINELGGLTEEEINGLIQNPIPIGLISMWSGDQSAIPPMWALCDGSTVKGIKTPNLRDRFVIGAGLTYNVGATGGTPVFTTTIKGSTKSHTLTAAEMPEHDHGYADAYNSGTKEVARATFSGTDIQDDRLISVSRKTEKSGGNAGHDHEFDVAATINVLPPFWALAYIIFVGP